MSPLEDVLYGLSSNFTQVAEWLGELGTALVALLVAASVIWLSAIGWRAFKAAVNKV